MKNYFINNWKIILILIFSIVLVTFISSYMVIQKEVSRIYEIDNPELANIASGVRVGIILGGGVGLETPSIIVKDRLDTAVELINKDYVDILLLSGDNSFDDYNEPQVMYSYLVQQGVPVEKLYRDFAGRSTYATCERAKTIFGINSALLISQDTHLPRAIYLCRHFGIDAYGVIAETETLKRTWVYQRSREFLARGKAVFNAYILGENTILGESIDLNL